MPAQQAAPEPAKAPRAAPQPAPKPAAVAPQPAPAPVETPTAPAAAPKPAGATAPPAAAASTPAPAPSAPPVTRPINPFLAQDPNQKARRLARALVSDMIVYQPEKRQRAIEAGTLKDVFDEEIKKSWEEYVEQVGEDLANSTGYFTEALNEILAGGNDIF